MRHTLLTLIAIFISFHLLFAQDNLEEEYLEEYNPCNGTWVLRKEAGWTLTRIEDGLSLAVPANATIYDCGKRPGELKEHMNNVKAAVRCSNSSGQRGEHNVEAIQIICE